MPSRRLIHPVRSSSNKEAHWWLPEFESQRADKVLEVAQQLFVEADSQRQGMARWSALYHNDPFLGTQMGFSPRSRRTQMTARTAPLALNGCKAVSDTYVALVTKDRPKVSCVTSGGDWEVQDKAQNIEKFVEGVFYENEFYRTCNQLQYDVTQFGTGVVKIADDRPRKTHIIIERVYPWEILVNPDDACNGNPQCLYQVKRIDRLILQELYPDFEDELATGGSEFGTSQTNAQFSANQNDFVVVVEAWRLPQGEDNPGRHSICCGQVTLVDEEYTRDTFPFEFLYRNQPSEGIWGQSLCQELSGLQLAVNKCLRDEARARALVVGHYMVDATTRINTGQISDRIGGFIRYRGTAPTYIAPPPNSDQNIMARQDLWAKMFETIGVSQQAAQSQKPVGLNSGKAQLVYADIQSQRFKPCYEEYQHFVLRVAHQVIATARDMDESFYVRAAGSKTMSAVRWADAGGLEDSEFVLKLYPTNALADDPASRMQQVQDLMTAGLIDPRAGRRLLDMPDLEEFSSYENASYNLVMRIMNQIVKGEEYIGPEPFMDLQEGIKLMQLGYLKGRLDNVAPDRLELMSRWISQAQALMAPPPGPMPPPGGAPPGPMPPPGGPPGAGPVVPVPGLGGPLAVGAPPPPPQRAL